MFPDPLIRMNHETAAAGPAPPRARVARAARLGPAAWYRRALALALVCAVFAPLGCSKRATPDSSGAGASTGAREVHLHPSAAPLTEVLAEHANTAKGLGLRPFVALGASWCKPCKELETSMGDPLMQAAFKGTYVMHLDIDEWGAKLGPAKLASSSIPVFFALDAAGKPTGRKIDGGAWAANVPVNMAPKLEAFFRAP